MPAPYFALYPTDFLADVGHLGNTELGIYWRLLLVYYRDGRPLPLDTDRLRRIAMTFSPEECRALDSVVAEFFTLSTEPDGTRVWRHKRADREIERAQSYMDAKRAGAAKAREKLAAKRSTLKDVPGLAGTRRSSGISADDALLSELIPGGEPEPEPEVEPESVDRRQGRVVPEGVQGGGKPPAPSAPAPKGARKSRAAGADMLVDLGVPRQVANDWLAIRAEKRLPLTATAVEALKREAAAAGIEVARAVQAAAENGWAGFKAAWLLRDRIAAAKDRGVGAARAAFAINDFVEDMRGQVS